MRRPREGPQWVIGWREWIALPDLGISAIKVKLDTGARSSALHASDIERFRRRGKPMLRFVVHPFQGDERHEVRAEAELIDERRVRNSFGQVELRPLLRTRAVLAGRSWEFDLTLTNRDEMGFRMLLGREALRGRFLVDPARSFQGGAPAAEGRP